MLGASAQRALAQANSSGLYWIVSQSGIHRLRLAAMPEVDIQRLFDNPRTFVIMNMPSEVDGLPHARHILYYRDEKQLVAELAGGRFVNADGALYDDEAYNEPGNTTPNVQKQNPLPYVQEAATMLHAAGKVLVYTIGPATGPPGAFWADTLPSVSRYADVVDFQTQAAEGTPRFAEQVAHYSRVFRGNGGHIMLVGLAASPRGQYKSEGDIRSAYDAAIANRPPVDGFWLNMAVKSRSCTGCAGNLDVTPMMQFLESIIGR